MVELDRNSQEASLSLYPRNESHPHPSLLLQVMLFTGRGGHLAYLGDKEGAEALAAELGHVRPKAESPAEFLLGMVSLTRLDVKKGVLMPSSDYEVLYKTFEQRRAQEGFKPIPCTSRWVVGGRLRA
jgi:methylase of polypeptide subunit release factors